LALRNSNGIFSAVLHHVRVIGCALRLWVSVVALAIASRSIAAQQPAPSSALVLDGVSVIDVEHGTRRQAQRVVVIGNRITAVGARASIAAPKGARIIDATGKYLIPGLWDVHTHAMHAAPDIFYPMFLANGVTGIRDAGSPVPLDTLRLWRQQILAGTRVGPPREILSGPSLAGPPPIAEGPGEPCVRSAIGEIPQTCVSGEADAVHVVDSLKAAGADMIKLRSINSTSLYYTIVREARRMGMLYGGHIQWGVPITPLQAADSGVTFLDHVNASGGMDSLCLAGVFTRGDAWIPSPASVASCQPVAMRLRRHNTWHVPTLTVDFGTYRIKGKRGEAVMARLEEYAYAFWGDSVPPNPTASNWLRGAVNQDTLNLPPPDSIGIMRIARQVGLPIVTGTDNLPDFMNDMPPGFTLHAEMAVLVAEGLTPLAALQAATLNPAKALRLTDSLGTVAPGKLADLVLLNANPLADITNTTTIWAVIANGRYFDRAALDQLLVQARAHHR
jgi:hypothetical protein